MSEPVAGAPVRGLPERIGRYRVTGRLGKGAMGVVYAARDDQMERDVAIKIMMADLEGEPETRARFFREAQITSKLLHRNIITVLDMGEEDGRPFIVMELLRGQTLGEYVKDTERHSLEQHVDLMIQTCEGLSVAHANGIVHRDIKPGNLFVLPDGALKILDFGVARLANSSMTASGLIVGTPDYMSPEQARGKEVDARSDVFSAAAVFYCILTGRKPFAGPDLPVVLQKVIREDPLPLREHEAPESLARIIGKALSKEPERRYQTFADMTADLVRFKRHFDAETRQLGATAKERYEAVLRAAGAARELGPALEMTDAAAAEAQELGVREKYPFFGTVPEGATPILMPTRRNQLMAVLSDLDTVLAAIASRNDAMRAGLALVEEGERMLAQRDAQTAIRHFEQADQRIGSASDRVRRDLLDARTLAAKQQAARHRLQALMAEARTAEKRRDWRTVDRLCAEVREIDPLQPEAQALASRATAAIAAEAEAQARRVQQLVSQATSACQTKRLDEADRLLAEARELDPQNEAVKEADARLAEARLASAARDAVARQAAEQLAAARLLFANGNRDAAIVQLEAFARSSPDAPGVSGELLRLRDEAARLDAQEQRAAQALAYAREAEEHWKREDMTQALTFAELALSIDRTLTTALHIQGLARTRLREQAEESARATEAAAHVARAVASLAAGRFDRAEIEARQALELQAGRSDAAGVLAEARRLQAEAEVEAQRQAALREREREIEKILKEVRVAIRKRDYVRAVWAAENALLIDPTHARAQELLAQAQASAAAAGSLTTGDADGTVNVGPQKVPAFDPEATAVVRRRAALKELAANVGDWASEFRRKLNSSR